MHPYDITELIRHPYNQKWFMQHNPKAGTPWITFQYGLNTGVMNVLETSSGQTNCTDPRAVFGMSTGKNTSTLSKFDIQHNFWSCAFYPNMTRDFRESRLSKEVKKYLLDKEVDTSVSSASKVVSFLSKCLSAYCEGSAECDSTTSSCTRPQLVLSSTMLSVSAVDSCMGSICESNSEKSYNPDIAGIGAISSYCMQYSITTLGSLAMLILSRMRRTVFRNIDGAEMESAKRKKLRIEKVIETMLISLNNFQQAQCCFVIAINIASMATLENKASTISQKDRVAISVANMAGLTPTMMVLTALLAMNERHSALTFASTFTTWAFILPVGFHRNMLGENRYLDDASMQRFPSECGGAPIHEVCGVGRDQRDAIRRSSIFGFSASVLLFAWYVWSLLYLMKVRSNRETEFPRVHGYFKVVVVVVVAVTSFISMFTFAGEFFEMIKNGDVNMEWSFGQIVAVTVWLPTLFTFFNDCVYGPVKGRTEQLPDSLTVMRA